MPLALLILINTAAAAEPAAGVVAPTHQTDGEASREASGTTPVRRRLRLPDADTITWSACLGFARLGSLIAWEVVEDDLWTLTLLTAAGAVIGFAVGALLVGGVLVAVGVGLLAAGIVTIPWLWVALGAGSALAGGIVGLLTGLPVGASVGLAASIDEGELSLSF